MRYLKIDLSEGKYEIDEVPAEWKRFLGGRGLAVKFLFEKVNFDLKPLSGENKLIFSVGPFTPIQAHT